MVVMQKRKTDQLMHYVQMEWKLLIGITVTGLIYNIGIAVFPYFEGLLAQCLSDILHFQASRQDMYVLCAVYISVVIMVQLARFFKRLFVRYMANHINRHMKLVLYSSILHTPVSQFTLDGGSLLSKTLKDVDDCVEGIRKTVTEIFDTGIAMISYVVTLVIYDWKLTLLAGIFPPLAYYCAERMKKTVTALEINARQSRDLANRLVVDRITALPSYRSAGCETNVDEKVNDAFSKMETTVCKAQFTVSGINPIYRAICLLGMIFVFLIGVRRIDHGLWNIAALTAYVSCYTRVSLKTSKSAALFNAVTRARVCWDRIQEQMQEVSEETHVSSDIHTVTASIPEASYDPSLPVLKDIHLQFQKDTITGITGRVASGKTLLAQILSGMRVTDGMISADGKPLSVHDTAYCTNRPEIFNDTIHNNITLGKDGIIEEVLHDVCLFDEVDPDQIAGVMGSSLSIGEQARVALARALYSSRTVLILDDPFASVDSKTEKQILSVLKHKYKDRIIILFSHRLDCFDQMDQVVCIQNGTCICGTHPSLLENNEEYRTLVQLQSRRPS